MIKTMGIGELILQLLEGGAPSPAAIALELDMNANTATAQEQGARHRPEGRKLRSSECKIDRYTVALHPPLTGEDVAL